MQKFSSNKIISLSTLFIILGLGLVACGGGEAATSTPISTEPPAALPSVTPPTEATTTTAPLPEPTETVPADDDESYPAPTQAPPPSDDAYPVPPTIAPLANSAYPGAEGLLQNDLAFYVTSFGPVGDEQELVAETEITILISNGQISGIAGCNSYNAQLTITENDFVVGPIISTQMACSEPTGVFEQEQAFLIALQSADGYDWQNNLNNSVPNAQLFYTLEDGMVGVINLATMIE